MTNRDRFLQAIIQGMGGTADLLQVPGVSVQGTQTRAENKVSAGYVLGSHLFVTCDPAAEEALAAAASSMEPTLQAFTSLGAELQGELLGGGLMYVLPTNEMSAVDLPVGFELRSLDAGVAEDLALIEQLISVSSEDDLDEAEIEIDDLDPFIDVVIDGTGQIAAYAAARPFDLTPEFFDIGILTRPDCRGRYLGKAAVTALCERLLAAGHDPLYRHDAENTASQALAVSLGFEVATELVAYRFA